MWYKSSIYCSIALVELKTGANDRMRIIRKTVRGCFLTILALVILGIMGTLLQDSKENAAGEVQRASRATATSNPRRATKIPSTATRIPPTATSIPSIARTSPDDPSLPPTSSIFAVTRYDSPLRKYSHGQVGLREGPDAMYAFISAVPSNSVLEVIGYVGEWYEISYDGGLAYVAKSGVFDVPFSQSSAQAPTAVHAASTVAPASSSRVLVNRFATPLRRYTHGAVNLRQGPGTDYGLAGSVSAGSTLDVVGQSGDWYVIRHNDSEVYMAAWLTFDSPLAKPVQQQPTAVDQSPPANAGEQPPATVESSPPQIGSCRPGPNNVAGVRYEGSCSKLRSQGVCGFPKGDVNYSRGRDRDRDNCGCDCE